MGKWVHRLSGLRPEEKTAICSECGPIPIVYKKNKNRWVCSTAIKSYSSYGRHSGVRPHGLTHVEAKNFIHGKVCGICGTENKLCVDHAHSTGKIRGVLCTSCNLSLGLLQDSLERLNNAIKYLQK